MVGLPSRHMGTTTQDRAAELYLKLLTTKQTHTPTQLTGLPPHYTQLRLKVTLTVLRHFQIKKRSPLLSKVVLQPCLSAHDIPVVLMGELEKSRVGKVR